jgi:hypothetical protein
MTSAMASLRSTMFITMPVTGSTCAVQGRRHSTAVFVCRSSALLLRQAPTSIDRLSRTNLANNTNCNNIVVPMIVGMVTLPIYTFVLLFRERERVEPMCS